MKKSAVNTAPRKGKKVSRKIFISWAKTLSGRIGDRFRYLFETQFPEIQTYISREDIEPGVDWHKELATVLPTCGIIVAFLTRENIGASEWMMYEVGAIASGGHQDERVVMILVDLEKSDIPPNSPYSFRQCVRLSDESAMRGLVVSLYKRCLDQEKRPSDKSIEERFKLSWAPISQLIAEDIAALGSTRCISASFSDDRQFARWANKYHDIVHFARDLTVRIMDEANPMTEAEVASRLDQIKKEQEKFDDPHNPPWKTLYVADSLDKILGLIDEVFNKIVVPGANVWSCLRYLRASDMKSGGYYHTLSRSYHHPSRRSDRSIPWKYDEGPVAALTHTIEHDERCVIIPEPGTPAFPIQHPQVSKDFQPASMMLGAVLTKQMKERNRPINVDLWWIICLSSDRKGVFTEAHKPVLQACNDVLSTVANAIIRLRK